jgi:hypothetical protein
MRASVVRRTCKGHATSPQPGNRPTAESADGPGAVRRVRWRRTPHASHRCRETHAGVVKLLDTSVSFTAQAVKLSPPTAAASGVGRLLEEPGVRASRSNRCLSRPELPEKLTSQGRCRPSVKGANCRPCATSPARRCALPTTQVLGPRRFARAYRIALVCRGRERVCQRRRTAAFEQTSGRGPVMPPVRRDSSLR